MNRIFFTICEVADCEPQELKQTCSYRKTQFRQSRGIFLKKNFLEILDRQEFDAGINIKSF